MIYWVWLTTRQNFNASFGAALLDVFGSPKAVWEATEAELSKLPSMTSRRLAALMEKDLTCSERILSDCQENDIRIVTLEEPDYPDTLREIPGRPLLLYVRGTLPDFRQKPAITIVGTRKATRYGLDASRYFAGNLAQNGCIIVSGMALGIDAQANRAAMDAGGETVAVLGCGVDVCYPWQHQELMDDIIRHGAVISEYPPGTEPAAWRFPQRNRIMTGLGHGTLIVEAPKKSGALISADYALEQGRDVFAVPGAINRPESEGCNARIREGSAELVQSPADILAHYQNTRSMPPMRPVRSIKKAPIQKPTLSHTDKQADLTVQKPKTLRTVQGSAEELTVWKAVAAGRRSVDEIVEEIALPASDVLTALTILEIGKYVKHESDGFYPAADVQI